MGKNVEVTQNANQFTQNAKKSTRCHHVMGPIMHCKSKGGSVAGYSGVNFGHLKSEVFQKGGGGGYSRVNFGHLKSEVFQKGG